MGTNVETLKKLNPLLLLILEVNRNIPPSLLSDGGKQLQQKLTECTGASLSVEATIEKWHDVIWLTSQMYKDRTIEKLSEDEQQLLAALQGGGFLTKDPDHNEDSAVFSLNVMFDDPDRMPPCPKAPEADN